VAEWSCSGLQSRLRRFDSDPSLISPVLRRTKKINGVAKSPESPANPAYRRLNLPASIDALCRMLSRGRVIAYIEAAYWGGTGVQAHAIFKNGEIVGSPVVADYAINQALRTFGVRARDNQDEFDTVGLGRHRNTDDWIAPWRPLGTSATARQELVVCRPQGTAKTGSSPGENDFSKAAVQLVC
jgi:hypothetical protein